MLLIIKSKEQNRQTKATGNQRISKMSANLLKSVRETAIKGMTEMGGGKKLSASKQREYFINEYFPRDPTDHTGHYDDFLNNHMNTWYSWKYTAIVATYLHNKDIDKAEKYLQKFIEAMMEMCEYTKKMVDIDIAPEQDYIEQCDRAKDRVDDMKLLVENAKQ